MQFVAQLYFSLDRGLSVHFGPVQNEAAGILMQLPSFHIGAVLGQIYRLEFLGRNLIAEHNVVKIHHDVAHLFNKMLAYFGALHDFSV